MIRLFPSLFTKMQKNKDIDFNIDFKNFNAIKANEEAQDVLVFIIEIIRISNSKIENIDFHGR